MTSNKSYNDINLELEALNVGKGQKAIDAIFSILFALLIISGPLAICINLFIFRDLAKLLALIIGLIIILFIYISDSVYLKLISKGRVSGISTIYILDTFIMSLVILGLLLILYELGVM